MSLIVGFFWGTIGSGILLYGKKSGKANYLIVGLLMVIYPWFVNNVVLCNFLGIALCALAALTRDLF